MSSAISVASHSLTQRTPSGHSNVFICFAEEEQEFAHKLDQSLRKRRRVSAIDWSKPEAAISLASDVLRRIEVAETFLFIVSPASVSSDVCRRQLAHAAKMRKVLVPVVRVQTNERDWPASLVSLTTIDYRVEADSVKAFEDVIGAANTNLRIDVFLCYARADKDFVNRLYEALAEAGRRVWLDLSSIPTSTIWNQEIFSGIEAADNFVLLISPDSMRPESFCHKEFAHATEHNKRIIPLYHREADPALIPPKLAQYQRRDFPATGDFEANFQHLLADLDENPEYLREHTRLLTRALEWQRSGNEKSLLLRGNDLTHAETLLRTSAAMKPQFTNLQTQYVLASREVANRGRNKIVGSVVVALILTAGLSVRLFFQTRAANAARLDAEHQLLISQARELVLGGESKIKQDPELSLLLAIQAGERNIVAEGQIDSRTASLLRRAMLAAMQHVATGTAGLESLAWKPSGGLLAAGSSNGKVVIVSASDQQVVDRFDAGGWVDCLSWTSDGLLLAAGTRENTVVVWNAVEKRVLDSLTLDDQAQSLSWRKDSRQLAIALARGNDSIVRVLDWDTRNTLFEVPGIRGAWSPDGTLLATGNGDGVVRIFTGAGEPLAEMPGHDRYVHDIAWTSDNARFATASVDDKVIVWDAVEHKRLQTLPAKFALGVTWSPDGSRLAAGSGESVVSVWDGRSYAALQGFQSSDTITGDEIAGSGAQGYIVDIGWSSDGKLLAVSERGDFRGDSGSLLFLPAGLFDAAKAQDWLVLAKSVVRRSLTQAECVEYFHTNDCNQVIATP
jgi:WD40 repeat protein